MSQPKALRTAILGEIVVDPRTSGGDAGEFVSFRADADVIASLRAAARANGVSNSGLARALVIDGLARLATAEALNKQEQEGSEREA